MNDFVQNRTLSNDNTPFGRIDVLNMTQLCHFLKLQGEPQIFSKPSLGTLAFTVVP